ncbi:nucleotide sugar dehydrogenase [Acidiplasma aeolicum]|jgi:UDP-N-acetyl-D-mannosaminuronic acid dehydrogenase|uniref:nucleotide sugar dehydrogenase n=1 Tax=Acidiplasma aeolicum TaxID=507754 RepID=UPI00371CB0DF
MYNYSISVIGLGYVGIPLSSLLAIKYNVVGFDIDKSKIDKLIKNEIPVDEPDLKENFDSAILNKKLKITEKPEDIKNTDIKIITVGTPFDNITNKIDTSQLISSLEIVIPQLKKGDTVMLKSTVPPGTTSGLVKKKIEESGFNVPGDIGLVFAPERMIEGQAIKDFKTLPKIIGATDDRSFSIASEILSSLGGRVIRVSNPETAEMVKMVDNYSRYVFLGLTNELALISEKVGVDVLELIKAAKNDYPRNSGLLLPGPGVGGSCLNKDPFILQAEMIKNNLSIKMIECSKYINNYMPLHVAELVKKYANNRYKVTMLGVAFKGDTNDTRFTPCFTISDNLSKNNFIVKLSDPFVRDKNIIPDPYKALDQSNILVLLTDHSMYRNMDLDKIYKIMDKNPLIIDTRGLIDRKFAESKGFEYHGVGRL